MLLTISEHTFFGVEVCFRVFFSRSSRPSAVVGDSPKWMGSTVFERYFIGVAVAVLLSRVSKATTMRAFVFPPAGAIFIVRQVRFTSAVSRAWMLKFPSFNTPLVYCFSVVGGCEEQLEGAKMQQEKK